MYKLFITRDYYFLKDIYYNLKYYRYFGKLYKVKLLI